MWVLLTQLIVLGPKQVHPQNGVDKEHEEQQAAHIEDSWQGAQQGVEQGSQTPANSNNNNSNNNNNNNDDDNNDDNNEFAFQLMMS